ncbi:hypothetical protein Tco_0331304 [Tanacetum coccineum]
MYEMLVRIRWRVIEYTWVHGERTQGVVKTLMNTKVGESKLSDIFVVRDFIEVFPEDLSMTTTTTSGVPHRFGSWSDVSCEVSISSSTLGNARIVLVDALSRKERVKPRRVRAMAMTIQLEQRNELKAQMSYVSRDDENWLD